MLVSIVIPTLNEAKGIVETITKIPLEELRRRGFDCEVIVVDGGSTDETDKIARELGARVVYEPRRGYGRAYKTGFGEAKGDIIVTLDGDYSYPPEYIPYLVDLLIKRDLDMIIARRIPEPRAIDPLNVLGNRVLSLFTKLLFRVGFEDSQSGMWVIKKEELKEIMPNADGMEFSEEIKIKAYLRGKRVCEVGVPYRKRKGKRKLKAVRDGLRNLLYLFMMFVRSRTKQINNQPMG
jgi:glycosyltransferase involved in cell wall biosynthesis